MESAPVDDGLCAAVVKMRQATTNERSVAPSFNRRLRRDCTMCTVPYSRILDPVQHFLWSIGRFDDVQVFDRNHFLSEQRFANPIQQSLPVVASNEDNREWFDLTRLNQRDRFEQLVECS